jgi:hypothetical protein
MLLAAVAACRLVLSGQVALGQTACAEAASPEAARRLAAQAFEEGQALFESNSCLALERFQCSFALVPHPNTLYNLGRSAEECGRADVAVRQYRAFLERYPEHPGRPEVEARLGTLEARVARPAPAVVETAQRPQAVREPRIGPEPRIGLEPEPQQVHRPRAGARRRAGWASLGVGGGLAVAGAVFLGVAAWHSSELDVMRTEDPRPSDADLEAFADEGRGFEVSGWVLLGVGGAALVAGVVLAALPDRQGAAGQVSPSTARTIDPWMVSLAREVDAASP